MINLTNKSETDTLFLKTTIAFAFLMVVQVICLEYVKGRLVIDPIWSERIIEQCGAKQLERAYLNSSLVNTGFLGLVFGAFYGLLF